MNTVSSILFNHLTKVNLKDISAINLSGYFIYAIYHPSTGKVWLSKTRSLIGIIYKVQNTINENKKLPMWPTYLKECIEKTDNRKIELHVGKVGLLIDSTIVSQLKAVDALLTSPQRVDLLSEAIWVIKHKPSNYYRLHRTSNVDKKEKEVLAEFFYHLELTNTNRKAKYTVCNRTIAFCKKWNISQSSVNDFEVILLLKTTNPRETVIAMNKYVSENGYSLCLNAQGISRRIRTNIV